jgi:hypothetical protein
VKVRNLIRALEQLPDQDATVVIADSVCEDCWLIITGVVERRITRATENPDFAVPGSEPGVEIV